MHLVGPSWKQALCMTAESVTPESPGLGDDGPAVHGAGSPGLGGMCCGLFIGLKCLWTQQPPDGVPGIPGHWGEEPMALIGGKGWHLSPSLPSSRLRLTNSEPAQHDKKETLTRQPGTKSGKCGFWFQTHPDSCSISVCIWPSRFSFLICKVKRMIEPSS